MESFDLDVARPRKRTDRAQGGRSEFFRLIWGLHGQESTELGSARFQMQLDIEVKLEPIVGHRCFC